MNSTIETGLFLPIRFYDTLAEQDRFKRTSEGVSLINEVYIFVDCKTLAPFQVIVPTIVDQWGNELQMTGTDITLVCVDGERIALPYNATHWEYETITVNGEFVQYLSYLGTDDFSQFMQIGTFYIELAFYGDTNPQDEPAVKGLVSDIFKIMNCDYYYSTQNFRLTKEGDNTSKRTVDGTNLRITTN